jgi:hypothetical protein
MSSAELKSVPVFVYPTLLNFYTNDANSYKQILTLFNPYDFPIKFKGIIRLFLFIYKITKFFEIFWFFLTLCSFMQSTKKVCGRGARRNDKTKMLC